MVDIGVSYVELQIALWAELQKDWVLQYPDIPVRADQVIVEWQNHLRLDEEGRQNEQGVKLGPGFIKDFFMKAKGKNGNQVLIDNHRSSLPLFVLVPEEILRDVDDGWGSSVTLGKSKRVRPLCETTSSSADKLQSDLNPWLLHREDFPLDT